MKEEELERQALLRFDQLIGRSEQLRIRALGFDELREMTRPVIERPVEWSVVPEAWLLAPFLHTLSADSAPASLGDDRVSGAVDLLAEVSVAGYRASVLAASDVDALARWLDEHGFDDRPALREWLNKNRRTYFRYGRRYLDWGVFVLRLAP